MELWEYISLTFFIPAFFSKRPWEDFIFTCNAWGSRVGRWWRSSEMRHLQPLWLSSSAASRKLNICAKLSPELGFCLPRSNQLHPQAARLGDSFFFRGSNYNLTASLYLHLQMACNEIFEESSVSI